MDLQPISLCNLKFLALKWQHMSVMAVQSEVTWLFVQQFIQATQQ